MARSATYRVFLNGVHIGAITGNNCISDDDAYSSDVIRRALALAYPEPADGATVSVRIYEPPGQVVQDIHITKLVTMDA